MTDTLDTKRFVEPGTGLHTFIGWTLLLLFGPLVVLATVLVTYGVALIIWLVLGITYSTRISRARAQLHGSAIRVGPNQFPNIYASAQAMAQRVGLKHTPDVYVIEDNQQNAFALKHGSRHCIVLIDDVVFGAQATGNEKALDFILAHEMAHHALGHTGVLRRLISSKYRTLSRLDEYSCDRVAHALIGDTAAARDAIALLAIGPQLFSKINKTALEQQAMEVQKDKHSRKSERSLSHPLLLHRYAKLANPVAG